ncbi:transposon ty3-i Gag-Pol polyprotein [Plakobranchus ocellatus]|uniref:Transposon ty3-i Gag-Pol polyprotein n=1 Tax=Plakobranchus ocellatus TaxID=259542 RepID=A0AAV4D6R5_9GAST|nr:transposon ty3-i Gag-Pol polyprotein [Plakobranchus ocellatus]
MIAVLIWSRPHGGGGRSDYFSKGHRSPSLQSGATRSPSRDRNSSNVASKNVSQGHFRPSSGSATSNVTCFQCGGKGHVRRECPSRPKEANFASSVPDSPSHSCECPGRPKEANVAFSVPELPYHCCAAKIDCNPRGALKIESCKVFDRVSTLLRDSGCNTVGVSKSLVPPDCYTGKLMLGRSQHVCDGGCGNDRMPDIERHVGVDREQLIKLQQEDPRILALVDAGRTSRRGEKVVSFEKTRGIVYRRYEDLGRYVDVKQVVLPKPLWE